MSGANASPTGGSHQGMTARDLDLSECTRSYTATGEEPEYGTSGFSGKIAPLKGEEI
jgi:hypothetical protein